MADVKTCMPDSRLCAIRRVNVVLALAVIFGCAGVMAHNQGNWRVWLSGVATMVLWGTLGYATWHGLGSHSTRGVIGRAQIVNIAISILFTLMILTIVFSAEGTPLPVLLPMALLTVPLLINLRALQTMKGRLDPRTSHPSSAKVRLDSSPNAPDRFAREESSPAHYLVRHWRGDMSFPMAFWVNGGALTVIGTALLSRLVSFINHGGHSLRILSFVNLCALLLVGMAWIWACVGIWRAAERYAAQGGSSNWRNAAQGVVVLGILTMIGPFSHSFLPQLKECALIASGHDPLGTIHITVSTNKKSLIVNGRLREGSAAEIHKLLDATPGVTSLMLNSSGGRVLEAKQLAQVVRTRQLDTYVEGECSSACTYVFLAGKDRAATPSAQIGFHPPSFPGIDPRTQNTITQDMLTLYRIAGLPEEFIDTIGRVAPDDMWYPTRDELIESHVITRVSLGGEAASFGTAIRSKQELRLTLQSIPLFQSIEKRFPGTAAEAVDRGWAVNEQGGADADMTNAVRSIFIDVYPQLLKTADTDTLDEFVTLLINEMTAARKLSEEACARLMVAKLDITKTLPQDIVKQEEEFLLMALATPRQPDLSLPDPGQVAGALQTVFMRLPPSYLPVVADMAAYSSQPGLVCDTAIAFYRAIAELPRHQRHAALQGVFQDQR